MFPGAGRWVRGFYALSHGLSLGALVGIWLAACLFALRVIQLIVYWPADGAALSAELWSALWMGLRFDAKVCAVTALLCWPLLSIRPLARMTVALWGLLFMLLGLINFYYYGFYKTPIDSVVFGVVDDDTAAIFKTIGQDFPLGQMAWFLLLAVGTAVGGALWLERWWRRHGQARWWRTGGLWALPLLVLALLLVAKGTLKGMALQPNNLTVTTQPFLNDAVPNGITALHNAWFAYRESTVLGQPDSGLRALGFESPRQAAALLGWPTQTDDDAAKALLAQGANQANGQHLVFFQMESWSAEPLRYQSARLDVMGRLEQQLKDAVWFDNFDAAHIGTHPALEAILFASPVTPISTGRYRDVVFPWGLAQVFKRAGYDTLFVTSGQSGWRELNRVLRTQGFDEFVDAATLSKRYPKAQGGIWGLWDGYMTRYIHERLRAQPAGRPLFVYAMSTTNHPPYEVPDTARQVNLDMAGWQGDRSSDSLLASLYAYRYANEVLADFVAQVRSDGPPNRVLVAATGDHNMRTVGGYAEPQRQVMRQQVPFMVWGAPPLRCPAQRHAPASHLDMFPTLLPMLGIRSGYLQTGRNLWDCDGADAVALTFVQQARTSQALWQLGHEQTLACQPPGSPCAWPHRQDERARARLALLDWNVRRHVLAAQRGAALSGGGSLPASSTPDLPVTKSPTPATPTPP